MKDDKIDELEARIKDLETWKNAYNSTSWPACTSVGGDNFFGSDMSHLQEGEIQVREQTQEQGNVHLGEDFNGGNDKGKNSHKRRRGNNPFHESTAQPPTKRKTTFAPNTDQEQSPYYRSFPPRRADTPTPVDADAHAGLTNCDMICYSNAIFQGIASCIHVTDFLQTPPSQEHQWFPLY